MIRTIYFKVLVHPSYDIAQVNPAIQSLPCFHSKLLNNRRDTIRKNGEIPQRPSVDRVRLDPRGRQFWLIFIGLQLIEDVREIFPGPVLLVRMIRSEVSGVHCPIAMLARDSCGLG